MLLITIIYPEMVGFLLSGKEEREMVSGKK